MRFENDGTGSTERTVRSSTKIVLSCSMAPIGRAQASRRESVPVLASSGDGKWVSTAPLTGSPSVYPLALLRSLVLPDALGGFFAVDGVEGGRAVLNVFTAAIRADGAAFFVFLGERRS